MAESQFYEAELDEDPGQVHIQGAVAALWHPSLQKCREIMVEGPAGCGKTFGILLRIKELCEQYPIRVLFARRTRKSMSDSVLVTWENKILGRGHPAIHTRETRLRRHNYLFNSGAEVVLVGLEEPGDTYSSEYDIIYINEAWQTNLDAWERLQRCLRHNIIPWQWIIADTNPYLTRHYLNQRANAGTIHRLKSRLEDNPTMTDAYKDALRSMSGHRRSRLYKGEWCEAEGMVFSEFDESVHVIDRHSLPTMKWYFGAQDWGYRAPGCLQIWGVDAAHHMYLIHEVYHTKRRFEWWADWAVHFDKRYTLETIVCDHDANAVALFNDYLSQSRRERAIPFDVGSDGIPAIARNAKKVSTTGRDDLAGLDHVMRGFSRSRPRTFLVHDALAHEPDPERKAKHKATCTLDEVVDLVWNETQEGRMEKDRVNPHCEDHGLDAMRYAHTFAHNRDYQETQAPEYGQGTWGDLLDAGRTLKSYNPEW